MSRYLNVNGSERGLQVRLNEEGNVAGAESALVPSKADVEAAIASFKEKYEAPSSPPPQPASTLPSVVPVVVVAPPTPSLKDNDMDDAASKDETALKVCSPPLFFVFLCKLKGSCRILCAFKEP